MLPLLAVAVLLAAGCSGQEPAKSNTLPTRIEYSGHLSDGGVSVSVNATLGFDPDSAGHVRVTFAPARPGYHLYSIHLPPGGVQGLGTPTSVTAGGTLRATGQARANESVRNLRLPELGVTLPVYPDGPVTVTLPVRRTGSGRPAITVTYGACSTATCLPPVRERVIPLG